MELAAIEEQVFSAAVETSEVLYNLLALSAMDVLHGLSQYSSRDQCDAFLYRQRS